MKKLLLTLIFTLSFGLLTSPLLHAAQSLEDQIKPYGIKMEDLDLAINYQGVNPLPCNSSVIFLGDFSTCLRKGNSNISKYIVVNTYDADVWQILQSLNNSILIISKYGNSIINIEGNFPNTFDGQAFSNKRYLLKYVGTFKYTNTLGSTSTVPKLKLIKELKVN